MAARRRDGLPPKTNKTKLSGDFGTTSLCPARARTEQPAGGIQFHRPPPHSFRAPFTTIHSKLQCSREFIVTSSISSEARTLPMQTATAFLAPPPLPTQAHGDPLRSSVGQLLKKAYALPCSTAAQAFAQLVQPSARFQLALDALLPLLDSPRTEVSIFHLRHFCPAHATDVLDHSSRVVNPRRIPRSPHSSRNGSSCLTYCILYMLRTRSLLIPLNPPCMILS